MGRRTKFIIIGLLVSLLLVGSIGGVALAQMGSVGSTGGTVLAQTGSTDNTTSGKTLLARVAEKLGIGQQELEGIFAEARSEMRDEALDSYLQKLIDEGKITEEEAAQYKAWLQARPDMEPFRQQLKEWQQARPDTPQPGHFGSFGGHGFRGGMKWGGGRYFWGR